MIRTQIQLPDTLYRHARQLAKGREISLAELVRRGLEYMISVSPEPETGVEAWTPPAPHRLGGRDPFVDPDWRMNLHMGAGQPAAESREPYGRKGGQA